MIYGVILELIIAAVFVVLGLLVWIKQKVSVLHEYQYKYVKREDIPAYTRQIGMGLVIIGAGIGVTGILNLLYSAFWWVPLLLGFVIGLIVIIRAQKKFNGSVAG